MSEEAKMILDELRNMNAKMSNMENSLKDEIKSIHLTLETETNPNIRAIAEGHLDLTRKLDDALKVENEKEMLIIRVNILENEVRRLKDRIDQIA